MASSIFINLPVHDLDRSKEFYRRLGFTINEQFTDENASCVVLREDSIFVMLLTRPFFGTFTHKEVADTDRTAGVINALSMDSREEVDELADRAMAAGAKPSKQSPEIESMHGRTFQDPDGNLWEVFWMDPAAMQGE
ncbi:VOC family protein [Streptomyces carpaticus]|uniref:VOC domain-containing protein n=2 Tax=Streptomyces TaxID=1883 RepID=A0A1I6PTE9_9ACTN|nr:MULTISPECIES: VOC family protein [Streptomyces]MCK1813013.1 VOC family protein [Streptomyces sp. XM4011]QKV71361.1 VOC family protein [Streptomyces harbinensis]UWM51806.1 VOC family protein [Streptomyces carpaticus]SFS43499.1 hypothetical protein SAMN05444716_101714 [Streptomyces harbinensis]